MASMKSIQFPGGSVVYEITDAQARSLIAALQGEVYNLVDDTLSETGKAADARATQEAIDAALNEAKGTIQEMGLSVVGGRICVTYDNGK